MRQTHQRSENHTLIPLITGSARKNGIDCKNVSTNENLSKHHQTQDEPTIEHISLATAKTSPVGKNH